MKNATEVEPCTATQSHKYIIKLNLLIPGTIYTAECNFNLINLASLHQITNVLLGVHCCSQQKTSRIFGFDRLNIMAG